MTTSSLEPAAVLRPEQQVAAEADDLTRSLVQLAREAERLTRLLAATEDTAPEAALARVVTGLGAPSPVLAAEVPGGRLLALRPDEPCRAEALLRTLSGRVGLTTASVAGTVFVLVGPRARRGFDDPALRTAQSVWRELAARVPCTAALSAGLAEPADLASAARDLRDLLALLVEDGERLGTVDDSWARILTRRAAAVLQEQAPRSRAVQQLATVPFRETLVAWLRHDGDACSTSEALGVHPNTLRYRLRRVEQELGLDLRDPHQRIALQLWALAPTS